MDNLKHFLMAHSAIVQRIAATVENLVTNFAAHLSPDDRAAITDLATSAKEAADNMVNVARDIETAVHLDIPADAVKAAVADMLPGLIDEAVKAAIAKYAPPTPATIASDGTIKPATSGTQPAAPLGSAG